MSEVDCLKSNVLLNSWKRTAVLYSLMLFLATVYLIELMSTILFTTFVDTFTLQKMLATLFYVLISYGFIVFILRKKVLAFRLNLVMWIIFAIVNNRKSVVMAQPFLFQDIALAWDAAQFAGDLNVFSFTPYFFLIIFFVIFVFYIAKYGIDANVKSRIFKWFTRLSVIILILLSLPTTLAHNFKYSLIVSNYNSMLSRTQNAGLVPVLMFEFNKVDKSLEYNKDTVLELRAEFIEQYIGQPAILPNQDVDVIVIMNESFTMPNDVFPDLDINYDVTPNMRRIQEESVMYGTAYAPVNGGGTCNVEFSFLTGYSAALYTFSNPLCYNKNDVESMVRDFNDLGFVTTGMHNYDSTMFYDRIKTFAQLGFQRTYFIDDMGAEDRKYRYYSAEGSVMLEDGSRLDGPAFFMADEDMFEITYNQLVDGEDNFILSVTMQNHAPFFVDQTHDGTVFEFSDVILPENRRQLQNYFNGLYNTDQAIYDFLRKIDEREKDTIVVFFGDHAIIPSLFEGALTSEGHYQQLFQVPYFIWANFETEQIGRKDGLAIPQIGTNLQELMGIVTDRVKISSVFFERFLYIEPYEVNIMNYINDPNRDPYLNELILKFKLIVDDDILLRRYHLQKDR